MYAILHIIYPIVIYCSSLLRNFLKSVHKDGDHTQDHDSNWKSFKSCHWQGRAFNVQENAVFYTRIFERKKIYRCMGETPLPHPPPLGRFAPSLWHPLLKNPGYAVNGTFLHIKCHIHTRIFKISLPWEGGNTLPRSVASLSRFGPLLTNPSCTTITGMAKGHKPPCPPLIGIIELQ